MSELKCGWLSPRGEIVPCEWYEHLSAAEKLVEKYDYRHSTLRHADDILLFCGWVRISQSAIGRKEWHISWDNFLTESQKNVLRPYFEDDEVPMSFGSKCWWERENL